MDFKWLFALVIFASACSDKLHVATTFSPEKSLADAEGPAVDANGNLYVLNLTRDGTVAKVDSKGNGTILLEFTGGSDGNGLRFGSDGFLYIVDPRKGNVFRADPATGQYTVYAHSDQLTAVNDLAITDNDVIYISDPDWKNSTGRVWKISAKDNIELIEEGFGVANGIEVSPDNKKLYVNEFNERNVWVFDVAADGSIVNKKLLIRFNEGNLDGMRCDVDGNLYITRYDVGLVAVVSPGGKVLREIKLIGKRPTNLAFGGKDGKTVYVTMQDRGCLETFRTDIPGREWQMTRK